MKLDSAPPLKVAIASSGLGHVRRGIESWAEDITTALTRRGVPVTLFGAGSGSAVETEVLPCIRRTSRSAQLIARLLGHVGGWRFGLGSTYEVEQATFAFHLWRHVARDYDLLHVQDPGVGRALHYLHRLGLSKPRVILANGTSEPAAVLRRFSAVQQLTPIAAADWISRSPQTQKVFGIPNFIDTSAFTPGDRLSARQQFELPPDAFIILCCAAIKSLQKRIDYLVREFAAFNAGFGGRAVLVVAGGREPDTDGLMALGRSVAGDRVHFLPDVPRMKMAELYRSADLFVLPSVYEPFGTVLLEAMATGLAVICHDNPTFRFIAGPAGFFQDLSPPDALAGALGRLATHEDRESLALAARTHVLANFSERVIVDQVLDMYRSVISGSENLDVCRAECAAIKSS